MLLGTFVNEVWWPSCGKLRECTRVGYESAYRCHIQPKWADVDMESITANDIEEWLGSFDQAGAARKAWAVLRAILRLAYRKGVTDNDVTRREIRLPHLRRYEPRVLDARQVRRCSKASTVTRWKPGYWSPSARDCADASPSALNGPTWIYAGEP